MKDHFSVMGTIVERATPAEKGKHWLDLVVLRFMARKIALLLYALERPGESTQPLSYAFEELRGRRHRVIIFAPGELLAPGELRFVGFVSRRNQVVAQEIVDAIFRMDELLLPELVHMPGLLSYSSLELRPGDWYNLVVFREPAMKTHVKNIDMHLYAAYELSPVYYEWVRLHNGTMPGGLPRQELRLSDTRYYHFADARHRLAAHEPKHEQGVIPYGE